MERGERPTKPPQPRIAEAVAAARNFHQLGELAKAEAIYRSILARRPNQPDCLYLMGLLSFQRGRHEDAVDLLKRALAAKPDWVEAIFNLGNVLAAQGRLDEAVARFERVLAMRPQMPEVHYNLGNVLSRLGRHAEAAERFGRALEMKPDWPAAQLNLGNVLAAMAQPVAAAAHYERGLALDPGDAKLHNALAIALHIQGKTEAALAHFERALTLEPTYAVAHYNLGKTLQEQARFDEAVARFERALSLRPDYAEAHMQLGTALMELRRLDEARAHLERGLALQPDAAQARSNLLLCLNYAAGQDRDAVYAAHLDWRRRHAPARAGLDLRFANSPEPRRRLRVGYVSRDFRLHSAFFFIAPLLEAHHRGDVEVVCYADVAKPDAFTRRLMSRADRWECIAAQDDEAVAARIRGDGIDILVDLSGHTAHNRLGVFARKPAPVQMSWLGYPNTTGLETIDCRITDAVADPPDGDDRGYSEALIRLPRCFLCYEPLEDAGAVAPLPMRQSGHVTFGSFNHLSKLTREVIALWARGFCSRRRRSGRNRRARASRRISRAPASAASA
jgi:protein O-GlcNAc transferase